VKIAKLGLVVCGLAGLAALIAPWSGRPVLAALFAGDPVAAVVDVIAFVLPAVMGAIALARPPMRAWQSGIALAGCVLGVVRFQLWDLALNVGRGGMAGALVLVALVIGTVAAAVTLMRPEGV